MPSPRRTIAEAFGLDAATRSFRRSANAAEITGAHTSGLALFHTIPVGHADDPATFLGIGFALHALQFCRKTFSGQELPP